jgi:hypothetical protein
VIEFDTEDHEGAVLVIHEIKGMSKYSVLVCIPLSQVEEVYVKVVGQPDAENSGGVPTLLKIAAFVTVVALVVYVVVVTTVDPGPFFREGRALH